MTRKPYDPPRVRDVATSERGEFETVWCPHGFAWCDGRLPTAKEPVQCDGCREHKRDTLPAPPPVELLDLLDGEELPS